MQWRSNAMHAARECKARYRRGINAAHTATCPPLPPVSYYLIKCDDH